TSTAVWPADAVKLWLPSLSVAPTGIAPTTSEARLLLSPARPLTVAPRFSAIAAPSTPLSATGARVGASGLTVTVSVAVVVVLRLPSPSAVVAATLSVKLASLVGVIVRLDRVQPWTSTALWPAEAVKLWLPSLSVAPSGIAPTTSDARLLLSPARPLTVAPRFNAIAAPSTPLSATGASVGASGLTVTVSVAVVVVLRLPSPSAVVAATLSVKLASLVGVIVNALNVQPWTSTALWPADAVKLWLPSLSVAPSGIALTTSDARLSPSLARPLTVAPRFSAIAAP